MKRIVCLGLLAALSACGSDDDDGTGSGGASGAGATGGSAGAGGGSGAGAGGEAGQGTGGSAASASGGSGASTGGSAGSAGAVDCPTCIGSECGPEEAACLGDPECGKIVQCVLTCAGNPDPSCVQGCIDQNPGGAVVWDPFVACIRTGCPNACAGLIASS